MIGLKKTFILFSLVGFIGVFFVLKLPHDNQCKRT
jgi:hypothetical protein